MPTWTVQQIVDLVSKKTERRADTKMDLRSEFFLALDELCGEEHFWWRKKRGVIQLAVSNAYYDLSGAQGAAGNYPDLAQLGEVKLLNAAGTAVQAELTPITDAGDQLAATINTTQATPSQYFLDTGAASIQNITLQAPSNVAQKVLFTYWAIPQVSDPSTEAIPLIPTFLQWGTEYALERRVYEFLYGQEDPRWQVSNNRYTEFIQKATLQQHWSARNIQAATPREKQGDLSDD